MVGAHRRLTFRADIVSLCHLWSGMPEDDLDDVEIFRVELGNAGGRAVPELVRRQTHAEARLGSFGDHVGKRVRRKLSATPRKPHGRGRAPIIADRGHSASCQDRPVLLEVAP